MYIYEYEIIICIYECEIIICEIIIIIMKLLLLLLIINVKLYVCMYTYVCIWLLNYYIREHEIIICIYVYEYKNIYI